VPGLAISVPTLGTIILTTLLCAAPLGRVHCLCVNVKGDPAVRISQELLNGLHVFAIRLQQCAEGLAEASVLHSPTT